MELLLCPKGKHAKKQQKEGETKGDCYNEFTGERERERVHVCTIKSPSRFFLSLLFDFLSARGCRKICDDPENKK